MEIDEGREGEKNEKDEAEKDKKSEVKKDKTDKKIAAEKDDKGEAEKNEKGKGEKKMEGKEDEKNKEDEGEKVESESEGHKKIEAEKDTNDEVETNEKGGGEASKEDEESRAKDDGNGETGKDEDGEPDKTEKSGVKIDQTGDADKDKRHEADAENAQTDGVEKIDGMQKRKSTESIESDEFCKVIDLTLTESGDDEEEEGDDINSDEKPPAYGAGDSVGEIQWWIWYAIHHHKNSTRPSFPSTTQSTKQLRHDLSCFDPTRQPIQKTWLNDRVIFHVLESLFLYDKTTQVLDPINLTKALEVRSNMLLHLHSHTTHLIAPYYRNDHWCLIIINLSEGKLEVYDTTEEANPAVEFLEHTLSTIHRWTVTLKPVCTTLCQIFKVLTLCLSSFLGPLIRAIAVFSPLLIVKQS